MFNCVLRVTIFSFVPQGKLLASCCCNIQTGCMPSAISHGSVTQFVKSKISASQIRGRVLSSSLGIYRYGNATWKLLGVRLPGRAPDFRIKWRTLSCGHQRGFMTFKARQFAHRDGQFHFWIRKYISIVIMFPDDIVNRARPVFILVFIRRLMVWIAYKLYKALQ